jgi:hypothetical protein
MLKVGARQYEALAGSARARSEGRIFALLAEHYGPTRVWPGDERARVVVRDAIDKADHYDMPAERDAFKLAALMLVFGDDFDFREPWAREIVAERLGNAPIAELLYREGIARVRAREPFEP